MFKKLKHCAAENSGALLATLLGLLIFAPACHLNPVDEEVLYQQLIQDKNLAAYTETTDETNALIVAGRFSFGKNNSGYSVAKALQEADNNAERVAYLKSIGCTGEVERYVELQSRSVASKLAIMKAYPDAKPSMLARAASDYRTQKADRPDLLNIAHQRLQANEESK